MYSAAKLFFFQAEDGIRDGHVTGVQKCALPISDQERSQRIAKSKKRYDRRRTYKAIGVGLIKREFGEHRLSLSNPFPADPPSGPCLDSLLRSEERRVGKECRSRLSPVYL